MVKQKILLVDSVPDNLQVLYLTLKDEYDLYSATNGKDALLLAELHRPDLILLDIMMPEINGFDVCRILKSNQKLKDIPVLFLTALHDEVNETRGFELGAVDYITKPFKTIVVKKRIATHLKLKLQQDILVERTAELEKTLVFLRKISESVPGVIYQFRMRPDGSTHFPYATPKVAELFNLSLAELEQDASPIFSVAHPDDVCPTLESIRQSAADLSLWRSQFRISQPTGGYRWYEGQSTPEKQEDGSIIWYGYFADIQVQKETEERIAHLAQHDILTNLPNRALLSDRIERALVMARRTTATLALLFIDLDKFKAINDVMGHEEGDVLLQTVARRIEACVREADTVARIGGDEFAVLLHDCSNENALHVAGKIRAALQEPVITPAGNCLLISSSIGVALHPEHGDNERDLLHCADEAMYRAKKNGGNSVELFTPDLLPDRGHALVRLTWQPEYCCGEPSIDREHRAIFRLVNILLEQAFQHDTNPARFNAAFDTLLTHVVDHFRHEEHILRSHHYQELEEHAEQHHLLTEHVVKLRHQADHGGVSVGELVNFFASEVVVEHLLHSDLAYFSIFNNVNES